MDTNVILTNKIRTHAQSNYTNTKLKAWFMCLLRHPTRKRRVPILHPLEPHGQSISTMKLISEATGNIGGPIHTNIL